MDRALQNNLRNAVTQCRRLLEDSIADVLEGRYGIYRSGIVEDAARMGHLSAEEQAFRSELLDHLRHVQDTLFGPPSPLAGEEPALSLPKGSGGGAPISAEAVEQLVREVGFTHLNRVCAYKIIEHRRFLAESPALREIVGRGRDSNGFKFFLAEHEAEERLWRSGQQDLAYQRYLEWVASQFADEIGALFSPLDPANHLFPDPKTLAAVLDRINGADLAPAWGEDESVGWVYQYYTPKELRDRARKESSAPRNSYELAFRNQFFTPRYVVRFLVDNTLGRLWYEMRAGETKLAADCSLLVRRKHPVFLKQGEAPPSAGEQQPDTEYVPFRLKKDPREIRVLDPACGSGHFLLYCFDLLETIYGEAYDDPDLGQRLRAAYPERDRFRRGVSALILRHNLYGIDIDLRSTQIAGLALWLRAQRAWKEERGGAQLSPSPLAREEPALSLSKGWGEGGRPRITRANLVCAEPMPGEADLLGEFLEGMEPRLLVGLARRSFAEMRLAGEAGSLLRVWEGIREEVAKARELWKGRSKEEQLLLFPEARRPKPEQLTLFDVADITDAGFFDEAEDRLLEALKTYVERAADGAAHRRRLFAEDAAQGFAFVDVSRQAFDVVLMNPPFGEASKPSKAYIERQYPRTKNDLYAAFVERGLQWLRPGGLLGAITSRTGFFLSSFQKWREEILLKEARVAVFADLGYGVLDTAMVETAAYCLEKA